MTPIVNGIKREYGRRLNVIYVSIDRPDGKEVAKQYGIVGAPTILLLDGEGNQADVLQGTFPPPLIEQAIKDRVAQ
jgi:thioredoxin-like negative regulator of GroEL